MSTLQILDETSIEAACIREAAVSTFSMICGEDPDYLGVVADHDDGDRIIGIMSLVGAQPLSVMISLPRDTAVALSEVFAGFEIDFDSADMGDVVGELVNVFAGAAVAQLQQAGLEFNMSLPTVVRGTDMAMPLPEGLQTLRVRMQVPGGPFDVRLVSGQPHPNFCRSIGS